jgi:hypothetical protein
MAELGYDLNEINDAQEYSEIPDGTYLSIVTESEWKDTKDKEGKYLKLTFQIIEDNQKGRLYWLNLNLKNKNETAVTIAKQQLKSICTAIGIIGVVKDSAQLHNQPLKMTLGRNKKGEQAVKKFESILNSASKEDQTKGNARPWLTQ